MGGEEGLKLNLGGRTHRIPGFKTVDLYDGPEVDVKADCSDLWMFEEKSVSEIYASHILEHWPHLKTGQVLLEWKRVLKPKGKLFVSVPDFEAAVRLYESEGLTDFIRNLLWGDQIYDLAFHYAGFTYATLALALMEAGFRDVKRITWMPYQMADCSRLVDTHTHRPISVTVEAMA